MADHRIAAIEAVAATARGIRSRSSATREPALDRRLKAIEATTAAVQAAVVSSTGPSAGATRQLASILGFIREIGELPRGAPATGATRGPALAQRLAAIQEQAETFSKAKAAMHEATQGEYRKRADRARRAMADTAQAFSTNWRDRVSQAARTVAQLRLPTVDPSLQSWNVFRLFGKERSEVYWTRWFANLLRPEHGKACGALVWRAVCRAVAEQERAHECTPTAGARLDGALLAQPSDWLEAAQHPPHSRDIEDEALEEGLGRVDLVVSTPRLLAVVENKLWADWHNWAPDKAPVWRQADRYRELGLQRRDDNQKLGLVLLTANDVERARPGDGAAEIPSDWVPVHWVDVARCLRGELGEIVKPTLSADELMEIWPVVLTLASLEQDILQFYTPESIAALLNGAADRTQYVEVTGFAAYLRRARHGRKTLV